MQATLLALRIGMLTLKQVANGFWSCSEVQHFRDTIGEEIKIILYADLNKDPRCLLMGLVDPVIHDKHQRQL